MPLASSMRSLELPTPVCLMLWSQRPIYLSFRVWPVFHLTPLLSEWALYAAPLARSLVASLTVIAPRHYDPPGFDDANLKFSSHPV